MAAAHRPDAAATAAAAARARAREEERVPLAPGDYSGTLPVDIVNMPVVPCPLIKLGNRVIICGRYADHHTCVRAANSLGVLMLSERFAQSLPPHTTSREDRFLADWRAFHFEIYGLVPKLPTVSGSKLDLFLFAQQILLLGGIDSVIEKRGFVVLAKQLRLSKPCTSAATVLRRAHQSLMHEYENKLMHLCAAQSAAADAPPTTATVTTTSAWSEYDAHSCASFRHEALPQRLAARDVEQGSARKKMRRMAEPQPYTTALQSAQSLQYGARLSAMEPTLRSHFSREEAVPRLPPVRSLTSTVADCTAANRTDAARKYATPQLDEAR